MKSHESAENYLETILMLQLRNGQVRSIDIANEMGFSKPSISHAMKLLREGKHITMDDGGLISLTKSGMEIAQCIYERHMVIANMLMDLGVDEKTAFEDACKVEHDLSDMSFQLIKEHYEMHRQNTEA